MHTFGLRALAVPNLKRTLNRVIYRQPSKKCEFDFFRPRFKYLGTRAEAYLVPNAHEKGRDFMPYFQAIPRSGLFVDVNTSFSCHYIIPSKR